MNWTYAAIILSALAVCSILIRRTQTRLPLNAGQKLGIGIGAFCGAMLGAKLPFVLYDWDGLLSGMAWLSHGKTIVGGLVGGYFGVEAAKWALDIRVKTGDTFAAPVALAVAIGRLGCYQAGCCFGKPTSLPWGVEFSNSLDALPRHPTQIYESLFHLTAACVLWWLYRRGMFQGQLIKLYIIAYLLYRFATEFLRPEPSLWFGLTAYQWSVFLLLPLFAWLWYRDRNALDSPTRQDSSGKP